MTIQQTNEPTPRKPLRLWPGVLAAVLLLLLRFVVPKVVPEGLMGEAGAAMVGMFGGLGCALAIVVWWAFFSRARWSERLGAVVLMIVAMVATPRILDKSIATASFAASRSRRIGPSRRRSSCGAGRSDRAGRLSRFVAISSTPRSSAATRRTSPATT